VIPDLRRPHPHSRLRRNRHSLGKRLACWQSDDSDGLHSEPLFVGHLAPRGGLGFDEWSCALLLQPKSRESGPTYKLTGLGTAEDQGVSRAWHYVGKEFPDTPRACLGAPIYPSINPASAASIMMDASEFDSYSKINLVRFLLGHSTIFASAIRILGFVENLRRIDRIPDSPW